MTARVRLLLAAGLALAAPVHAQGPARGVQRAVDVEKAVVPLAVSDEGLHTAIMLQEMGADEQALRRVSVHMPYRLVLSGVAISRTELLTTALHPDAELRIVAHLPDGREMRAELVGTDPLSGLALVRLTGTEAMDHWLELDPGAPERFEALDLVGHHEERPVRVRGTVSCEHMNAWLHDLYGVNRGKPFTLGSVFLVVASASQLNPGSACVTPDGRLKGLVLGAAAPKMIPAPEEADRQLMLVEPNFAIPAARIARIVAELREHGAVTRARYGVTMEPVTDALRAQFDLPASACALVDVEKGGPADRAGLQVHDVILAVDGKNQRDPALLAEAMTEREPGKPVKIKILRAGQPQELTVTPTAVY